VPVVAPDPYSLLLITADFLDDVERLRISTDNRLRSLEDVKGLAGSPDHERWQIQRGLLGQLEANAVKELERAMKQHPLGAWVRGTPGVGPKQGARLLAATGDPYWNHAEDRPRRGPAELWRYCGFDVGEDGRAPKRRAGVKGHWNPTARMRARLIAEKCTMQVGGGVRKRSPYRDIYERERAKWAERETSDGHKHNHALRVVAKALLADLWAASKAAHESLPAANVVAKSHAGSAAGRLNDDEG